MLRRKYRKIYNFLVPIKKEVANDDDGKGKEHGDDDDYNDYGDDDGKK